LIFPVTTDPRCNRRAIASRNVAESLDRSGRSSIKSFYTTYPARVAGSSVNRGFAGLSADGRDDNHDLQDSPE
jgi:hypothetical protein